MRGSPYICIIYIIYMCIYRLIISHTIPLYLMNCRLDVSSMILSAHNIIRDVYGAASGEALAGAHLRSGPFGTCWRGSWRSSTERSLRGFRSGRRRRSREVILASETARRMAKRPGSFPRLLKKSWVFLRSTVRATGRLGE